MGISAIGDSLLETLLLSTAHGAHSSICISISIVQVLCFLRGALLFSRVVGLVPVLVFWFVAFGSNQRVDYLLPALLLVVVFVLICLWWWVRTVCGVCF